VTRIETDICVLGAGSGGLTVAAAAASFGVPVVLVERDKMGGDCLNSGCVPSKALIAAARHAHSIRAANGFGIRAAGRVNFAKVQDHVAATIAAIAPNDSAERFGALGVRVIAGHGRFIDGQTVEAGDYRIAARRFVIATGSSPFVPPIPGLNKVPHFTNESIFANRRKPSHLVTIGGGPVGLELAQAHLRLGAQATVVEAQTALGREDPELAALVLDRLRGEGMRILERTRVVGVEARGKSGIRVRVGGDGGESHVDGSDLLVAAGRSPNVGDLGLEAAGIEYSRAGVKVDAGLRTTNRRVYAIGDVAGGPQFTHVASHHAGLVIRSILFRQRIDAGAVAIPRVTFTDPELAQVGVDEREAVGKGGGLRVLRWPFSENDRAQAERRTDGLVKIVTDRRGRVLGAGIVGAHAGELIGFLGLAIEKKLTARDIAAHVAPYPTFGEAGKRAAIGFYAPLARKPIVRSLVSVLRRLG
jgi:pyruvate/2-oxoglutarate dehydrogenase complex dihydrolipoamide dehydrogenase (E3) component